VGGIWRSCLFGAVSSFCWGTVAARRRPCGSRRWAPSIGAGRSYREPPPKSCPPPCRYHARGLPVRPPDPFRRLLRAVAPLFATPRARRKGHWPPSTMAMVGNAQVFEAQLVAAVHRFSWPRHAPTSSVMKNPAKIVRAVSVAGHGLGPRPPARRYARQSGRDVIQVEARKCSASRGNHACGRFELVTVELEAYCWARERTATCASLLPVEVVHSSNGNCSS